jgi:monosaccharide-transporting ATPase
VSVVSEPRSPAVQPPASPLLSMRSIDKAFNGVPALMDASFEVGHGEVRALIGQNGAGKSTLIKVLTGVYRRDSGDITFDGRPVSFGSPSQAQRGGIATIFQEVNLVPHRSVAENIALGQEPRRYGFLDWSAMNARARTLLSRLEIEIDVARPLRDYPIATQQMTAIARALSYDARLVIMDEPTSSLAENEVQTLFTVIRRLQADGVSIVFVSHRLDELYAVCGAVTVMRDGRTVLAAPMDDVSRYQLVSTMLGRELTPSEREMRHVDAPHAAGEAYVRLSNVATAPAVVDVSLEIRRGEVLGVAGLLGSGRSETARAIFGADPVERGDVAVAGKAVKFTSPRDAIRRKFGFLSEDRKVEGIIPDMSVRENITLALLPHLTRNGIVDRKKQAEIVDRFISRLGIKTAGPDQKIRELSGGNQQKVLLARWLCTNPELLILDEPTRGIDVGAKQEIQELVRELADEGLAVLLISSELEELIGSSDRVVVLRDGRNVASLRGTEISADSLMAAMAEGSAVDGGGAEGSTAETSPETGAETRPTSGTEDKGVRR